ncbi:hypothetical protein OOT00_15685 [Desulfobotulus sp. H1]|uniref:Polysaccharide deacetylase n=1 Tax=Desulfobotulus pelophilus TaxID=2823377 RepID=A0ABT3ND82_9BACT|nr:hypothetical protein [Desulfobotulus pelophilus]MCW7755423.1 hypothetical protein [Desulfobotulus pelophilus]
MIFRYDQFKNFIQYAKKSRHISPLGEWDGSNAIILRHDVDFDLELAYRLSLIEAELDVRSTFFVLTTCATYNVLSVLNRKILREMVAMGFEIGLHFDPTIYATADQVQLASFVDEEAKILSSVTGSKIKSISLHNPSIHGQYPFFEGYINAYDKHIFSDELYISDSCMNFRGKDPYEFIRNANMENPIQVVLHPLHFSENNLTYPEIFYEHIKRYSGVLDSIFRVNSKFTEQMHGESMFDYIKKKNM